jgi:hypothetical protein
MIHSLADEERSMTNAGLDHWYCDVCDGVISDPAKGMVIAKSASTEDGFVEHDFLIVHKGYQGNGGCDPGSQAGYGLSMEIRDYLGLDGQAWLLALLSPGPLIGGPSRPRVRDFDEFVDLFRRLQTPYYEDARRRFGQQHVQDWFSDANQVLPYTQDVLQRIAGDQIGS